MMVGEIWTTIQKI